MTSGRRAAAIVVLSLVIVACAGTPTPYQPASDGFGYAEQQIEANRYRVSFTGNASTPREVVQNYLLYRAAELTLQTGHDHFELVDQSVERSTRYRGTGSSAFGYGYPRYGSGLHYRGAGFSSVTLYPIDEYTAFADVVVLTGEKPAGDVATYDARDVIERLGPTIVRAAQ